MAPTGKTTRVAAPAFGSRPALSVVARVVLAGTYASLVVLLGASRSARLEGHAVGRLLNLFGEHRAIPQRSVVLVHPVHGLNLLLHITWSCSSAPVLAAVGAAGLLLGGRSWWRRAAGLAAASALVIVVNILRLATSVEAATRFGLGAMLIWHDWAGTGMTLIMGALAIWLCLRVGGSGRQTPALVGS